MTRHASDHFNWSRKNRPRLSGGRCDQKKNPRNVQTADVMALKNPKKSKKTQVRLLGFVRCQHPKFLPAGIVPAFVPRRTAQRAGISPFRNARWTVLEPTRMRRKHICNTDGTVLLPLQRCSASVRKLNTNNRASTRDTQAGIQGGQVIMLVNIKLAIFWTLNFDNAESSFEAQQEL